jgi:uncharacterized RDD family membrane protein YckC
MAAPENPYQPPKTELGVSTPWAEGTLAPRGARLAGSLIDTVAILALMLPLQWSTGTFRDMAAYSADRVAQVQWGLVGLGVMSALNGYFWATRAQSIGKMAVGTKIVTLDGHNASFGRIFLRRVLPVTLLALIPWVGSLVALADAVLIFRSDQRCLHDHIAGTRVVRA